MATNKLLFTNPSYTPTNPDFSAFVQEVCYLLNEAMENLDIAQTEPEDGTQIPYHTPQDAICETFNELEESQAGWYLQHRKAAIAALFAIAPHGFSR